MPHLKSRRSGKDLRNHPTVLAAEGKICPTCHSPDPARHPAMQHEGEVQVCSDPWHSPIMPAITQ